MTMLFCLTETSLRLFDYINMQISLKGTNIQILESTTEYVDNKLVKTVEKFIGRDGEAISLKIEVERTTKHHRKGKIFRAEANLSLGKKTLYSEAFGETLNEAIDLLEEELEREIKHFKGRARSLMLKRVRKLRNK